MDREERAACSLLDDASEAAKAVTSAGKSCESHIRRHMRKHYPRTVICSRLLQAAVTHCALQHNVIDNLKHATVAYRVWHLITRTDLCNQKLHNTEISLTTRDVNWPDPALQRANRNDTQAT